MSYFDNLRVIAHGGGSDQARACRDKKCPQCDDDDWGEDYRRIYMENKLNVEMIAQAILELLKGEK